MAASNSEPLLKPGTNFSLPKEKWPEICTRIEQILAGQGSLFPLTGDIEQEAQSYAALLVSKGGARDKQDENCSGFGYQEVDISSLELVRPRPIGVEHVGLAALQELHLPRILAASGLNKAQQDTAIGCTIWRQRQRGHSKEKRSDCPLVTLGPILDGNGFVRRSWMFAGNVCESATFKQKDGRTLHVRKTTTAEPKLQQLYNVLGLSASPGTVQKLVI